LIYFINKVNFSSPEMSPAVCVFHKRQLYRVTLSSGGESAVDANYRKVSGRQTVAVKQTVTAARILLEAAPLGDYGGEVEDFSFLGFKRDVELLFDPVTRIPIMIGGHLPGLGHSVLKLHSVHLTP
jgi:hypothetical protein